LAHQAKGARELPARKSAGTCLRSHLRTSLRSAPGSLPPALQLLLCVLLPLGLG